MERPRAGVGGGPEGDGMGEDTASSVDVGGLCGGPAVMLIACEVTRVVVEGQLRAEVALASTRHLMAEKFSRWRVSALAWHPKQGIHTDHSTYALRIRRRGSPPSSSRSPPAPMRSLQLCALSQCPSLHSSLHSSCSLQSMALSSAQSFLSSDDPRQIPSWP